MRNRENTKRLPDRSDMSLFKGIDTAKSMDPHDLEADEMLRIKLPHLEETESQNAIDKREEDVFVICKSVHRVLARYSACEASISNWYFKHIKWSFS